MLWLNHLKTDQENRKRGATKAAQTRKKKGCNKKGSSKVCTLISSKSRQQHIYSQYHFNALTWAPLSLKALCGYCKKEDPKDDKAETVEWIQCDTCDNWCHQVCALTPLDNDMFWHCTFCYKYYVKQFTSIFSSTECVCNCLPKLDNANKY